MLAVTSLNERPRRTTLPATFKFCDKIRTLRSFTCAARPYRYFASEGFLPGYSFPRLPLAAFIPAERRTRNGQGDYLQRPRFLAISEFGPGAFIYHEGTRYEVNRVSLPARDDGTGISISEINRC